MDESDKFTHNKNEKRIRFRCHQINKHFGHYTFDRHTAG